MQKKNIEQKVLSTLHTRSFAAYALIEIMRLRIQSLILLVSHGFKETIKDCISPIASI